MQTIVAHPLALPLAVLAAGVLVGSVIGYLLYARIRNVRAYYQGRRDQVALTLDHQRMRQDEHYCLGATDELLAEMSEGIR